MNFQGPIEAALSTDLRGQPYNFTLWDIHTGTQLVVFKGNVNNPRQNCLQFIDNNYFITAIDNIIQVWSIFNRKCQDQKLFLPDRPSTLNVSPCGNYLVVGICEMIYVWQLRSGNLLAHTQRHYQSVTVLKFNHEGTFLISAAEDGMVLVWPFADLISNTHNTGALNLDKSRKDVGVNEPRFTWQHHSAQVTDLHITNGGRCITCSVDMTCNIYSYADGKRLYCVTLPTPIWSVVMNKNETRIFLGGQEGDIYEVSVSSLGLTESKPIFSGHKKKIIKMILSLDGSRLISASLDSTCKVWDIYARKMIQDIKHQAPLANLTSLLVPEGLALSSMAQSQTKPPLTIKALKRGLHKQPRDAAVKLDELFESTTVLHIKNKIDYWSEESMSRDEDENLDKIVSSAVDTEKDQQSEVPYTIDVLKAKLRDLYKLSAEKIFKDAAEESLVSFKIADVEQCDKRPSKKERRTKKLKVSN